MRPCVPTIAASPRTCLGSRLIAWMHMGNRWRRRDDWLPSEIPTLVGNDPSPAAHRHLWARPGVGSPPRSPCHAYPARVLCFDARMAWLALPALTAGDSATTAPVTWAWRPQHAHLRLEITVADSYLDYDELATITPPRVAAAGAREQGIVLSGKLPNWCFATIAPTYRAQPWLAVYQPQLHDQAVVVQSNSPRPPHR